MKQPRLLAVLGLVPAIVALTRARADDDPGVVGKAGFMALYHVLESPRCMNCHPAGDAPLQFDDSRPHAMNISRRSERNGVACAACHRDRNGLRPGQPPGAPNWHLPPAAMPMVFEGRSPHQLCEQLKDPAQTKGRDIPALIEHVAKDELVGWGWAPGPGRKPVPIPREQVTAAMKTWFAAGAPCPE